MSLDVFLRLGETVHLGTHTFSAEEIKRFAAQYDPQPFHLDEEAARQSLFGRLCASGWHTCAMWMRYNLRELERTAARPWEGEGPRPQFGPSPGFSNLKWLKPVYAGDTITFTRTALSHRPLASRPGWRLVSLQAGAVKDDGEAVLSFDNAVLLKVS
ncbi:MaoC family dehydratase [Chelativorans intermedius]|uniref:MaoC family dehydratase n=1 Tax=Chelativorans intermedius TaxID=515947 RepID=A0ABV6D8E5_9HYPH|nr:MaoC family dehydratase [Chelativorans intermedius]MCT8996779.1 MaoC family dehydratase [Chelativorans intermedius]